MPFGGLALRESPARPEVRFRPNLPGNSSPIVVVLSMGLHPLLPCEQKRMEQAPVSYKESSTLRQRLAASLRRRLHPNTALHAKQLAYALRVSEATVWQWLAGNRDPGGEHLLALINFFDAAFANEIVGPGCVIAKASDLRAAKAIGKMNEARAELLAVLNGTAP